MMGFVGGAMVSWIMIYVIFDKFVVGTVMDTKAGFTIVTIIGGIIGSIIGNIVKEK